MSTIFDNKALRHLVLVAALVPIITGDNFVIKLLSGFYGVWMLTRRSWSYLPALMVLISFLSNSYFVYLSIPFILLVHSKQLKNFKMFSFYLFTFIVFGFVLYFSLIATWSSSIPFGLNYARFEIVSSITAISFGAILKDRLKRPTLNVFLLAMVVLISVHLVQLVTFVRTIFYIFPFTLVYLIFAYYNRRKENGYQQLIFAFVFFLFVFSSFTPSFTLLLTALHGSFVYRFVSKGKVVQFKTTVGLFMALSLSVLTLWSINNFRDGAIADKKLVDMDEVTGFSELMERGQLKLLKDRAPLWAGALIQIIEQPYLLPPKHIESIQIENPDGTGHADWDYHAHNVYLEVIRTCGFLLGGATVFIFLGGLVKAKKGIQNSMFYPEELLMYSSSVGVLIIGSFIGIYVLSGNFSFIPLSVLGYTCSLPYRNE